jgi:hypothetical protein
MNRILFGVSGGGKFIVFLFDTVEDIVKRWAQPIAQPAAVAYIEHPRELRLKIGGVPIERIVNVESHRHLNYDLCDSYDGDMIKNFISSLIIKITQIKEIIVQRIKLR